MDILDLFNKYQWDKPFIKQGELCDRLGMSNTTLKRYMSEWAKKGNDLEEMGHLIIDGFREACWVPKVFLNWLYENKVNVDCKYDYEIAEQQKLKSKIINYPNNSNKEKQN